MYRCDASRELFGTDRAKMADIEVRQVGDANLILRPSSMYGSHRATIPLQLFYHQDSLTLHQLWSILSADSSVCCLRQYPICAPVTWGKLGQW